jgi:hypothetical protein
MAEEVLCAANVPESIQIPTIHSGEGQNPSTTLKINGIHLSLICCAGYILSITGKVFFY